MTKEQKKKALKFAALMTDMAEVMVKHGIDDMVAIYGLDGEIRNTYLPLKGEVPLYCHISDAFNEWLRQGYHPPKANPKAMIPNNQQPKGE